MSNEQFAALDTTQIAQEVTDPIGKIIPDIKFLGSKNTTAAASRLNAVDPRSKTHDVVEPKATEQLLYKDQQAAFNNLSQSALDAVAKGDTAALQEVGHRLNLFMDMKIPDEAKYSTVKQENGALTVFYTLPVQSLGGGVSMNFVTVSVK